MELVPGPTTQVLAFASDSRTATAGVRAPLFDGLPRDALVQLEASLEVHAPATRLPEPGERPMVRILVAGWVARQSRLADGRRQIVALMFPGDVGPGWMPVDAEPGEFCALTRVTVLAAPAERLASVARRHPELAERMAFAISAEAAIGRAWLTNLGQRKAPERVAHLFCEVSERLARAGLARHERPFIPLAQQDLADALGMTSVHVNRVLQRLRKDNLIEIRKGGAIVCDKSALAALSGFSSHYLPVPPAFQVRAAE